MRPQTKECIRIAEQANVPIVVAINKCDLHDANPSRTREELLQCGLTLETYGGMTQSVEISALTGAGCSELAAAVLLQAELASNTHNSTANSLHN